MHGRRGSEGGLEARSYSSMGASDSYNSAKQKMLRKARKPRSWHPSPYASDDDDDMFSREEKKQKIKAEISRRRQQIEENSRLHEELLRLARLRETAELGFTDHRALAYDHSSPSTSVLRSIDEILRDARDPNYHGNYAEYSTTSKQSAGGMSGGGRVGSRNYYGGGNAAQSGRYPATEEDRSIARLASTFQAEEYGLYDRYGEYDDANDFTPAMPLLPDMPTRSRKILENLGSAPISSHPIRSKYEMSRRHRK